MTISEDITRANAETQLVLLEAIKRAAEQQAPAWAEGAARYAEAWAWLRSPNNSHSGGAKSS